MTEIPAAVASELPRLRAENARLLKMLELSPRQAAAPGPEQEARQVVVATGPFQVPFIPPIADALDPGVH